ncbi:type II secretion system protein G [Elusimicrobium posterum]|uniref:type IV pilin protein n=1 Tax=Elusimicrobium posterum TaxID=3116653 RepID=UPI003C71F43C
MKKGFTLIELLVVVLIIGILAAIALPQYQKAVEKSRVAEAVTNLETFYKAQQLYHQTTGSYTKDLSVLDIQMPGTPVVVDGITTHYKTKHWQYVMYQAHVPYDAAVFVYKIDSNGNIVDYRFGKYMRNGKRFCQFPNTKYEYICKEFTGITSGSCPETGTACQYTEK